MAAGAKNRGSGQEAFTSATSIRNVVVVGHSGAGKTSLVEGLLVAAGALNRPGRVEDGTTVSDHEPIEQRLGRSVSLSVASVVVPGGTVPAVEHEVKVNLVDTPGHPDFVGELRAGLRAADAAVFVVSAVDGIDGGTRMLWQECESVGMPRAVAVTHLDQRRADFEESLAVAQRLFGDGVQPLYLPLLDDQEAAAGVVGLLTHTVHDYSSGERVSRPADPEHVEGVEQARRELVEGIIQESEDDTLLDRWLAGGQVDVPTLIADLEKAVARGTFYPVLPVVATGGLGMAELLEVVLRGFPCPAEHPVPAVTSPDGQPWEPLTGDPDGPLVAEVVKTTSDPYVGRLSLVRVFSGTLTPDATVHVCGHFAGAAGAAEHDLDERVGAVSIPLGAALTAVPAGVAGDLVAVARLSRAETGDTLSAPERPALMEPWVMPDPLLPCAVTARTTGDDDKLSQALARLVAEDPTVRVQADADTHQIVLWCMGETHRDVQIDRLANRFGVDVDTEPVKVSLRETVAGHGSGHGRHVKQSGGHGQFAICDLEVDPLPEGAGFVFVDRVVGGAVPRSFIPSVEKGARAQLARGVAAGYPVVDVQVTLTGGKAHSVDSSDAAFQTAAALAVKEAVQDAGASLLEPVDQVQVVVDDEYVGAVMSDLSMRRGRLGGSEPVGTGRTEISAEVPAMELTRYAVDLRSLAHGTGTFTRSYLRHAPMPQQAAARILSPA